MKTPKAIDSEKALLGSLMQDAEILDEYIPLMQENMFFDTYHRYIYRAIDLLYKQNEPINQLSVVQKLREINLLQDIAYIADVCNRIPTSGNAKYYYNVVNKAFKRRSVIQLTEESKSKAYNEQEDIDTVIDELQTNLNGQAKDEIKAYSMKDLIMGMDDARNETLRTGFHHFDLYYGGLNRKELSIIGGRPSMGKTAYAMSLMLSMANRGYKFVFFSLEMSRESVIDRFVSMHSEIDHEKIKQRFIEEHERAYYSEKLSEVAKLPIKIIDTPRLSIYDIKAKTRQFVKRGECDIIFIDYLQIMKMLGDKESTSEKIGMSTSRGKDLAKELNIHVSMLSQLNRQAGSRKSDRPNMKELRGSGEIEQDADMIIFPYRPYVDMPDNYTDDYVEIHMAKNRNGSTGYYESEKGDIRWMPNFVKFKEVLCKN